MCTRSSVSFIQGELVGPLEPKVLKNRFRSARLAMQSDIGLPTVDKKSSSSKVETRPNDMAKMQLAQSKGNKGLKTNSKFQDSRDGDEEPDGTLQIPGEVVLAREPRDKSMTYWPARVLQFSPQDPEKRADFHGYIVQFFPEMEEPQKIRRSYICSTIEEAFTTCKVGFIRLSPLMIQM